MRWVVDAAILILMVEWLVLGQRHRRTGRGLSGGDLAGNMLSGIALLLALRAALSGAGWRLEALWLLLALVAHVIDLRRRLARAEKLR